MLDNLGMAIASISLLLGGALLYDSVSTGDASQAPKLMGGAVLLSVGLTTMLRILKNKLEWRRNYKKYREG